MSLLGICKILRLFVNTLAANDKYSLLNRENLTEPLQILLSEKKFFAIFLTFWKFRLNIQHFAKEITHIADVFPILLFPKYTVR